MTDYQDYDPKDRPTWSPQTRTDQVGRPMTLQEIETALELLTQLVSYFEKWRDNRLPTATPQAKP